MINDNMETYDFLRVKRCIMIIALSFVICHLSFSPARAQIGTWRSYMSYYEPQQIVKAGDDLFVRASNDLYQYNLTDQSITTYDKITGLSDSYITVIAWNNAAQRLIVVYQNSNIDLIDRQGNITNISAIYTKSMTGDKTINDISIMDDFAFLATGFGLVKLNMKKAEVSESFITNISFNAIGINGGKIYARTDNGYMAADLTANLINPTSWTTVAQVPAGIFDKDNSDWEQYIETVKTLKPGGPKHNYFGFMRFKNNMLYSCGGGYNPGNDQQRPATIQLYNSTEKEWTALPDDMTGVAGTESNGWKFVDMMAVDVDPLDSKHIIATGRTGMYEYQDGAFVKYHNKDNSLLKNATSSSSNKYVLTLGSTFDHKGNYWCVVSQTKGDNLVEYTKDKQWVAHSKNELYVDNVSLNGLTSMIEDSRNLLWFVNYHWDIPSFYCYNPETNKIVNYWNTIYNQDGTSYNDYRVSQVAEDLSGNIWLCTNLGPFMVESANVSTQDTYLTQVKVPRNDGSNFADYLLAGVNTTCMAVDGGGRKWFGTYGAGVYLISADNLTQIYNFTTANSPLISDNIESIAIDNETGEVFFGTDCGLCSYLSDATSAAIDMVKDNVYAYPNPVASGYNGLITVVGLSLNADVKIVSTNGKLIAEGRSNGGTFTWDGRDRSGRRVASGIYMVVTATSDGKKGTVCKIAVIK